MDIYPCELVGQSVGRSRFRILNFVQFFSSHFLNFFLTWPNIRAQMVSNRQICDGSSMISEKAEKVVSFVLGSSDTRHRLDKRADWC